jgi:hypothetical protein
MVVRRKRVITAAAVLAVGTGGVGIAQGVSSETADRGRALEADVAESAVEAASGAQDERDAASVAQDVRDDADERARGGEADRAAQAAVDAVGGERVAGVERESEGASAWEVEIVQSDGREVDVDLDRDLQRVATDRDDGAENESGDDDAEDQDAGSGDD